MIRFSIIHIQINLTRLQFTNVCGKREIENLLDDDDHILFLFYLKISPVLGIHAKY